MADRQSERGSMQQALLEAAARRAEGDITALAGYADQIQDLICRSEAGDEEAVSRLRQVLTRCPEMWHCFGDFGHVAEDAALKMVSGGNLLLREGLRRHLAELRQKLAEPGGSPLEALLIDRIALCWLQAQNADIHATQMPKGTDGREEDFRQRQQDRAHQRFISACRALANVRRLLRPQVTQVNVAEQQINIAQSVANSAQPGLLRTDAGSSEDAQPSPSLADPNGVTSDRE
ncbi:hypothetical protein LLH03_03400 [bacterium]|nr:hypothetical protein [bacterium]